MPTNEERRDMADRLWRHIGKPLFTGQDVEDIIGVQRSDFDAVLADASYRRLADLIEPEERTCRDTSTVPCKFTCSECHQSWRKAKGNGAFAYCPCCGARVVDR